jgi:hypothetical protein
MDRQQRLQGLEIHPVQLSIMAKLVSPLYLRSGALDMAPAMLDGVSFRPHVRASVFV